MRNRIWSLLSIVLFATCIHAEDILLVRKGGVYYTPVTLNEKVELEFIVDSGASLVYIPNHVFETLKANGSLKNSDILGKGKSKIANGDIIDITIINIKKLKIGQREIKNVRAAVGGDRSSILLGQSALKKLEPWSLDTQKNILRITSAKGSSISKGSYVSASQKIDRTEILGFIHHYLLVQNNRSVQDVASLYGSKVTYLNKGAISNESITLDKEKYFRRWQKINNHMIKLVEVKDLSSSPGQKVVKYSAIFDLYNDFEHKGISGQTMNTLVLKKANGSIKIISEKVKILNQNRY